MVSFNFFFNSIKEWFKTNRMFHSVYPSIRLIIHIILYTITSPITNLINLLKTFWACRVLSFKERENYAGFNTLIASILPYYYRYSLELSRFGRRGVSPNIGFGNYPMNKFFFYTESVPLFRKANNHFVLICLIGWLLSHLLWITDVNIFWVSIIMVLTLLSTTFLASLVRMNYNIMGFLFLPLALFGIQNEYWYLVGFAWLGISFGSITVLLIGGFISIAAAFMSHSLLPILAFIPACLKISINLIPLLSSFKMKGNLLDTARFIGLIRGNTVRYKRPKARETLLAFDKLYYSVVLLLFILMNYISIGYLNIYLIVGFVIFLLNSSIARFADEENIWMLILTFATYAMLQSIEGNYLLFLVFSFWLLISPYPTVLFLGRIFFKKFIPHTGSFEPKNIKPMMDKFIQFFSKVDSGGKIFMAFYDPGSKYVNVFDGLRFHIEFPLYITSKKGIHLFPDWMAVIETNYIGAPNCWGREPEEVLENIKTWDADYAMVYQKDLNELDQKWNNAGFKVINHVTWQKNEFKSKDNIWFPYMDVSFWLLQPPISV